MEFIAEQVNRKQFEEIWAQCIESDKNKKVSSDFQSILTRLYVWMDGSVSNTYLHDVSDLVCSTCPSVEDVVYRSALDDAYNESQRLLMFYYNRHQRKQSGG